MLFDATLVAVGLLFYFMCLVFWKFCGVGIVLWVVFSTFVLLAAMLLWFEFGGL